MAVLRKRPTVCTRTNLFSTVQRAEDWLNEGRAQLLQFGRSYALKSPMFLRKHYTAGPAIQSRLERLRDYFACPNVGAAAREHYQRLRQEIGQFRQQIERSAGEERMREGYFGDLGRYPWKPRARRGPMCRRVWVRSHKRTTHVKVD